MPTNIWLPKKRKSLVNLWFTRDVFYKKVPRAGVEPARIAPLVFETSASTDSAIWAFCGCKDTTYFWIWQIFIQKNTKYLFIPIILRTLAAENGQTFINNRYGKEKYGLLRHTCRGQGTPTVAKQPRQLSEAVYRLLRHRSFTATNYIRQVC